MMGARFRADGAHRAHRAIRSVVKARFKRRLLEGALSQLLHDARLLLGQGLEQFDVGAAAA